MNLYEELSKHYADCAARRDKATEDREGVFKRIQENLGKELGCGYDPRIKVEGSPDGTCAATVGFLFSKSAKVSVEFQIEKVDDGFAVRIGEALHDLSTEAGWSALWPGFYQALRRQVDEAFRDEHDEKGAKEMKNSKEESDTRSDQEGTSRSVVQNGGREVEREAPKPEHTNGP